MVRDSEGHLADSSDEVRACWHAHFDCVLNSRSNFDDEVIQSMPSLPVRHELDDPFR